MKVFISSIGSRGDIEPILALAVELQAMGHRAVLGVMPNFQDWVQSRGVGCIPFEVPRGANRRQLARDMVRVQFQAAATGARGCDLIMGFGMQPCAGRSIAEHLGIPYVYATNSLPLLRSAPGGEITRFVDRQNWDFVRDGINHERAALSLPPLADVRLHAITDAPLLAIDPVLVGDASAMGTWFLRNESQLGGRLETFLAAGEPPIYFGFGSTSMDQQTNRTVIEAARALGSRAIISHLTPIDNGTDVFAIGNINCARLFPRCAAIVHAGGVGNTAHAARSGRPQVVMPRVHDQFFWAHRVRQLGVGTECSPFGDLADAVRECMKLEPAAHELMSRVELCGARIAAERLVEGFGRTG